MIASLQNIAGEVASIRASAAADYRQLVASLADGETIFTVAMVAEAKAAGKLPKDITTTADVLRAIDAAGKTLDQLGEDVARLIRRRELVKSIADRDAAEADRAKAQAEANAIVQERDAALAAFQSRINAAVALVEQATARVRAGKSAENELRSTADPAIKAALVELNARRDPAREDLERHRAEVDRLTGIIARPIPELPAQYSDDVAGERRKKEERQQWRELIEAKRRAEADIVGARARFDAAGEKVREIVTEIAELQSQMLTA